MHNYECLGDLDPFIGTRWSELGPVNALPLHFLMLIFVGWVNRHQQDVIEYFQVENRALREQLGGKRLRLTDQQRRRLAGNATKIGRNGLSQIETLVTLDTLLLWHRQLITRKYDGSKRRGPGRPRTAVVIREFAPPNVPRESSLGPPANPRSAL